MNCIVCGKQLCGRQRKFCSAKCRDKEFYDRTQKKNNLLRNQKNRAMRRKRRFIDMLGGKCSVCGYNHNMAALDFHHVRDKKFPLSSKNICSMSIDRLLPELEKCVLLCANCHRELHHPNYLYREAS